MRKIGLEESPTFLRKKKGEELTKAGTGIRGGCWDLLFLWRDRDRGALQDRDSGSWDSSSSGVTKGPCGTRTSSFSGGTATATGCNSETSSSTMCILFALGTSSSSSLMCMTPNSSFIISNVICKNAIYPNSLILEREISVFFEKKGRVKNYFWQISVFEKKRKGEELFR
jgi:hypothetical protein